MRTAVYAAALLAAVLLALVAPASAGYEITTPMSEDDVHASLKICGQFKPTGPRPRLDPTVG